jgi:hypothetical protein
MRSVRLLNAALLSVVGIDSVTSESASANSLVLTASHSSVMKYEHFTLSGKLLMPKIRTVKLQYKSGDTWIDKASMLTVPDGSFEFDTFTGGSRTYRYYAPRSGTSATIIGAAKTISVVSQKVTAYLTPNPLSYSCADPGVDETVNAVVTVSPIRAGREISFISPNGALATGETDGHGHVVIPFNLTKAAGIYSVTVTAGTYNGASAASAAPASVEVKHLVIVCG